ncbi:MAG: ATP-grasp domain-containing protein, partial [Nitrospinota bacterium]
YGFLAENADFAAACEKAGLVFIGPSSRAIALMGDKTAAKRLMAEAGIPVIPGMQQPLENDEEAQQWVEQIGLPVMLKSSFGGGGKGMRLVRDLAELPEALRAARSESRSSFGNPAIYIEKWIEYPRHVEMQIMADHHGHYVYLGERECSIQRRHQKLIEESPSPIMTPELRKRMGEVAVKAAQLVGYTNAGTVEFLVDRDRNFYFLEMNTRLQVEHPVTEMVTGLDLVKEQIAVAAGKPLSFTQEDIRWQGAAIECRIYAEDPDNNFRPSPGVIQDLRVPGGPGVRDERGFLAGAEISPYYDPLISKLITWGRDRQEAIARMRRALAEYQIAGIKTTIPFHRWVMENESFMRGDFDTEFIDREYRVQVAGPKQKELILLAAAIGAFYRERRKGEVVSPPAADGINPWKAMGRFELFRRRL